jgi:hypothetical protein
MRHDDHPVDPGDVATGCKLWALIAIGFLIIAGVVLAIMAVLGP